MRKETIEPWGRIGAAECETVQLRWAQDGFPKTQAPTLLPFGLGRSYGDSCLNTAGAICKTRGLRLLEAFDPETGELTCGAGTSLEEILETFCPLGWFPPVVPGTKFVTVGGSIANDIHGKNHHKEGTWGRHVKNLTLLRSDTETPLPCSDEQTPEMFRATVGGLGLTGIITSATIKLKKIGSTTIDSELIPFGSISEFFSVNAASESPYTVAWVDLCAKGADIGRGIYMSGDFSPEGGLAAHKRARLQAPEAPGWALNPFTVKAFNSLYRLRARKPKKARCHYDPFFFPLDAIGGWNKIYGRRGFYQYQSVVPMPSAENATREMLGAVSRTDGGSFLAVMKTFGAIESPGLLSFPKGGFTLAMDFPNRGEQTLELMGTLDKIVAEAGGRLYPAKDGRMRGEDFRKQYPGWETVETLRDPKINSDFWRRTAGKPQPKHS